MRFKIKKTKINISFSFFAVFLIFFVSENFSTYFYSLVASVLHELVHIAFICFFKAGISEIDLSLLGGNIKRAYSSVLSNKKEAIISLSAPLVNVFIGLVCFLLTGRINLWITVNLFIGAFNLLPFYSFDGGRGLFYLLLECFSEKTTNTVLTITSIIVAVIFSFASVFIFVNHKSNLLLLLMSVYMIFCIIFKVK